jgi:hypothetical protein
MILMIITPVRREKSPPKRTGIGHLYSPASGASIPGRASAVKEAAASSNTTGLSW